MCLRHSLLKEHSNLVVDHRKRALVETNLCNYLLILSTAHSYPEESELKFPIINV